MTTWSGHWHGYHWKGDSREYFQESLRRPGKTPGDAQTRAFMTSSLPPMQTGHWLLKREQADLTLAWRNPAQAVAWLRERHAAHPPNRRGTWPDLDLMASGAADHLPRGVDVTWAYWTTHASLSSASVVCCPNRFHPHTPCPLPPS